ncbi:ABC transporter ATP-binding protein [Streptomyces sp. 2P-4]|uniref:ABC transporter ATP-binding protein n=1 Tax=Streptomyces sp. 2P-4 TaxID=2931974 RepID=UPI00253F8A30|nr:ABC transporter ATP-binding protein [Streptomyces sp. 2P-4]
MKENGGESRRSLLDNIRDAFRISRQAGGGLFALAIAIPAVEGIMAAAQLLALRGMATAFFVSNEDSDRVIGQAAPWLIAAVGVTVIALVADNARHVVQELLSERVKRLSAARMHQAIALLELEDFDDPTVHDRISRAEATADYRPTQVVRSVMSILAAGLRVLALAVFLMFLQPLLVPAVFLAAVPVLLVSSRLAGQRFSFHYRVTPLERRRRYVGWLLTARQPAAEVRSFRLVEHFSRRYDELSRERLDELRGLIRKQWRGMMAGQLTFTFLVSVCVGVLAWFYGSGRIDAAGLLTAVLGLARLAGSLGSLGGPISELSEASHFLNDQHAFYQGISAARAPRGTRAVPGRLAELRVEGLTFTYPGAERPALDGVDLTIRSGEMVAFVGPNGSGKTTLAKILAFLYQGQEGKFTWNGVDVKDLDVHGLRDQVTTVFQDHMTYHLTVGENVALGDIGRDGDQPGVLRALDRSGAGDVVARLPKRHDTVLGSEFEDGVSLSGGEAQRLAIARAFYRDRDLVVLDEPTSALDAHADHRLLGDLRTLLNGRTAAVVSHRFSNVRHADRIYVLKEGQILEEGTHDALMAAGGLYAEMYSLQASAFTDEPKNRTSMEPEETVE